MKDENERRKSFYFEMRHVGRWRGCLSADAEEVGRLRCVRQYRNDRHGRGSRREAAILLQTVKRSDMQASQVQTPRRAMSSEEQKSAVQAA